MRKAISIIHALLGPRLLADRVPATDRCRLAEAAMGLCGDPLRSHVVSCTCPRCLGVSMVFPPHIAVTSTR